MVVVVGGDGGGAGGGPDDATYPAPPPGHVRLLSMPGRIMRGGHWLRHHTETRRLLNYSSTWHRGLRCDVKVPGDPLWLTLKQ
ncbi:hypothetical protein E2C01_092379 [Portunus trituberculatus]|uniref:Uncharacterized protein n=1 Tax=Portunus trituberculatus TaxID=210409 RepID=A0A5B7JVM7_PORTR|nr:hypothetical protein [Portunus trituberculatus]